MSRVSTYVNFQGQAEEAFLFYGELFGTQSELKVTRFRDLPPGAPGRPGSEDELDMLMHAELPILAGHVLMATDMLESMGHRTRVGNNVTINLEPDTREEADRLFAALSQGSTESSDPAEVPWGYWGVCLDRFGIRWMFNVA